MACTKLLALCLLVVIPNFINAESDADAESDAFYGYSRGAAVLRSYPAFRRSYYSPYAYRRPYGRYGGGYHAPARRYTYRVLGPSPAPAPLPVPHRRVAVEPYYAPAAVAEPLQAVPAVPVEHFEAYGRPEVAVAPAPVAAPVYSRVAAPVPAPYHAPAPAPYHAPSPAFAPAPEVVAVPAPVTSSQYHAQDEFGNVSYGYKNPNSAKQERRDAYGNVEGGYSYVDATGIPKHLSYVADDYGFRVTSTNALPFHQAHPAH